MNDNTKYIEVIMITEEILPKLVELGFMNREQVSEIREAAANKYIEVKKEEDTKIDKEQLKEELKNK